MRTQVKPEVIYTRGGAKLEIEPKRSAITEALRDTVGLPNLDPNGIKLKPESKAKKETREQKRVREYQAYAVKPVENFDGKLESILQPSQLRAINNSRALDKSDIIDAINGDISGAAFDYVINAVGELLGLPAKEAILKLCK